MYALKNKTTGQMLGFTTSVNQSDHCVDISYILEEGYTNNVWSTESLHNANAVLNMEEDHGWYNQGHDSPGWSDEMQKSRDNYVVVKLINEELPRSLASEPNA